LSLCWLSCRRRMGRTSSSLGPNSWTHAFSCREGPDALISAPGSLFFGAPQPRPALVAGAPVSR
jgi:hypothetical protein